MGFIIVGSLLLLIGPFLMLFPGRLPNKNSCKSSEMESANNEPESLAEWSREFLAVLRRLSSNRLFMFNLGSTIAFGFPIWGLATFIPKYLEFQFHQKASTSGGLGGLSKTVTAFVGIMLMGILLTKFRFRAKTCAALCAASVLCRLAAIQ
jgi:hypothetical protein